jgi:ketosteroid isomerase-like protein
MRVQDGKVTEATAFFDAPMLTDLFERIQIST